MVDFVILALILAAIGTALYVGASPIYRNGAINRYTWEDVFGDICDLLKHGWKGRV